MIMKSQLFCPEMFVDMRYKPINNKKLRWRHEVHNSNLCKILKICVCIIQLEDPSTKASSVQF